MVLKQNKKLEFEKGCVDLGEIVLANNTNYTNEGLLICLRRL